MIAVVVTTATLFGNACSTSEWDTSDANATTKTTVKLYSRDDAGIIESLTDYLSNVGTNLNEWAAPVEQARCASEKVVGRLTSDRLLELGYDPQKASLNLPYSPDERTAVSNILVGCIDFQEGLLSMITAYGKLKLSAAACLTRGIDRQGLVRDVVSGVLSGGEPDPFANDNRLGLGISRLMIECFDVNDLLPILPQAPFPQDVDTTTTSIKGDRSTTTTIDVRAPIDTTATTGPTGSNP